jgi:hypothetical protein
MTMKTWMTCFSLAAASALALLTTSPVSAEEQRYYHCTINPPSFDTYYWAEVGTAIGICQSYVNQTAASYCASVGNAAPWQMSYNTGWVVAYPNDMWETSIHSDSVWWQCIDGGAYYA